MMDLWTHTNYEVVTLLVDCELRECRFHLAPQDIKHVHDLRVHGSTRAWQCASVVGDMKRRGAALQHQKATGLSLASS